MENRNLYRINTFKSRIFPDLYFVASKPYLIACLLTYISSLFFVDYFSDSIAFYTQNIIRNLITPNSGIFQLKRLFLQDIMFDLGFCAIFGGMLLTNPRWFFCFYGHQKFDGESLWISFLRVFMSCFASSVALIIFFGFMQGFFFWFPKWAFSGYLEYTQHAKWIKKGYSEAQFAAYFGCLSSINLSLICIFFVRIGIITTILQGILIRDKRFKLVHPLIIIISLIPVLFLAARYIEPQHYQTSVAEKSSDKEKIAPINLQSPEELIKEPPKASISIYDPNTGTTISNH